ncbi:antitoxin DinJ [Ventosimonas gracilis]|uniref:Antitoxin DinJ n=1 Tax=Ventosimonas gracilis TaxID=1680762 RepID=A0A139SW83_9GAMM|nr:type II toxin-antitoxin system RelB/DinJ family antitoxin [Ventosimonas gracilis]KXU38859.1 antitoxin DinJ [Ventosimonas gracilis]
MSSNALVSARISESLKQEAAAVLATMGLTLSDFIRIGLIKVVTEKTLPFDLNIPNELTVQTLNKSERGEELYQAENAQDLFKQLGI